MRHKTCKEITLTEYYDLSCPHIRRRRVHLLMNIQWNDFKYLDQAKIITIMAILDFLAKLEYKAEKK